jgi:acid phosphatase family membrane protein YuiD
VLQTRCLHLHACMRQEPSTKSLALRAQGVTTALAMQYGLASPLFAVSLAFSVIVMYDAMGVRRHAGKQAEVLNQVRIVL